MEKIIIKNINKFYFIFFSIFLYKLNQIFFQEISIYFRQYDLFGLLTDGFLIYKKHINLGNNFNKIKIISFSIMALNIGSLYLFLKKINLNNFSIILISLIFIFLHNFQYRFYYGHIGLQIYFFIFFTSYILLIENLNIIKKSIIINCLIILSIIFSAQYIYYNIIILIFLFFTERKKSGFYNIKKKEIIILLILVIIFLIIMLLVKDFYFVNYDFSGRDWTKNYINKYSIINPLELLISFKYFYSPIIDFIDSEQLNFEIEKYKDFLKYYSPNGPEFTFFVGISIGFIIIYNQYKKIIKSNFTIPLVLIINLIILNNFYPFSLIILNEYLFPFVRSIQRILIIIDFLIIYNLAYFFKNYQNKKYFLIIITFLIIIEQEFNFKKSNISINNNLYILPIEIRGKELNFFSPSLEHTYISNYLKKNNKKLDINNTKTNYNLCIRYDNCFKNFIRINNFFDFKK